MPVYTSLHTFTDSLVVSLQKYIPYLITPLCHLLIVQLLPTSNADLGFSVYCKALFHPNVCKDVTARPGCNCFIQNLSTE